MKPRVLRGHHLYCLSYADFTDPARGQRFNQLLGEVRELLGSEAEHLILIAPGTDEICRVCPFCAGSECNHPHGGEAGVRKWDATILGALGLAPGEAVTNKALRGRVEASFPLSFCLDKCRAKKLGVCRPDRGEP